MEFSEDDCRQKMPPLLRQGIDEFNAGQWFECHETLEELWVGASGAVRDLYQGILQVAVALHHWREGNFPGAVHLLQKGNGLLEHAAPVCQGVDVAALMRDAESFRETLENLGPDRMAELDRRLIPRISPASSPPRENV